MSETGTAAPVLTPETVAKAIWDAHEFLGRGVLTAEIVARFGNRLCFALDRLPQEATIGDLKRCLFAPGDKEKK